MNAMRHLRGIRRLSPVAAAVIVIALFTSVVLAYTVQPGDTLWKIARDNSVSVGDLKAANGLAGDGIYPGQHLTIPGNTSVYTVQPGDALWSIAQKYAVSVSALKAANGLTSDSIYPGQKLTIPGQASQNPSNTYAVKPGDSLWGISQKYGVSVSALKTANGLAGDNIHPGQVLRIPGGTGQTSTDTAYWVDVDISEQRVRVKQGDQAVKVMVTSSGKAGYDTPQGTFEIQNRGDWFFNPKYGEGAKWWVSFKDWGVFLFHTVAMDQNQQIIAEEASKLGTPASHGCLRLAVADAKWIYDNVPQGAKVVIHA